jgi:hypothetical protein
MEVTTQACRAAGFQLDRSNRFRDAREGASEKGDVMASARQCAGEIVGIAFSAAARGVGVEDDECDFQIRLLNTLSLVCHCSPSSGSDNSSGRGKRLPCRKPITQTVRFFSTIVKSRK